MINTWDIFDTLIARRCIHPHQIFLIVERISKISNFAQARVIAEGNLQCMGGGYNLDDIYEELQKITGTEKTLCDNLKRLECDVELEQVIPITENILKVKAGDILISDMYLPDELIYKMLKKAGLNVPVEIIVTSDGKSSGRLWNQFADQKIMLFHVGDNVESDAKKPISAGLESIVSNLSNPNAVELYLLQKDFAFAAYLREIRLRNNFTSEIERMYWNFFTLNIGVLLSLIKKIDELQKKYHFEYLGFCGRDTYYMRLLYEKYKLERGENPVPNDYLYYSRKLVRSSGNEMSKYFSAKMRDRKALMIDLVGTGTHLHNLREKFDLDFSILICIKGKHSNTFTAMYPDMLQVKRWISALEEKVTLPTNRENFFILELDEKTKALDNLELLNRGVHNSPIRLQTIQIDKKILPTVMFSQLNDTESFDVIESCMREVLNSNLVVPTFIDDNTANLEEFLLPMISTICSSFFMFPLKGKHLLAASTDDIFFHTLKI